MENKEEMKGQSIVNVNVSAPGKNSGDKDSKFKIVEAAKDGFKFLNNATYKSIAKVALTVILALSIIIIYKACNNIINDGRLLNLIVQKAEDRQKKYELNGLNIRSNIVTPKIQEYLSRLCYSMNADRAFLFELHNGKRNSSGLPFRFADMSYEEVNEEKNVESVALEFQDIPLTLYKYPNYLAENKYIYGSVQEIAVIDNGFAGHIERIGGKYLAMIYLVNKGVPLGFLCISYHDVPTMNEMKIKEKMESYAKVITPMLDMNAHLSNQNNDDERLD